MLHRSSSSSSSRGTNTCDTTYAASVAVVAAPSASADRTTSLAAATYEATYRAISCHTTITVPPPLAPAPVKSYLQSTNALCETPFNQSYPAGNSSDEATCRAAAFAARKGCFALSTVFSACIVCERCTSRTVPGFNFYRVTWHYSSPPPLPPPIPPPLPPPPPLRCTDSNFSLCTLPFTCSRN